MVKVETSTSVFYCIAFIVGKKKYTIDSQFILLAGSSSKKLGIRPFSANNSSCPIRKLSQKCFNIRNKNITTEIYYARKRTTFVKNFLYTELYKIINGFTI